MSCRVIVGRARDIIVSSLQNHQATIVVLSNRIFLTNNVSSSSGEGYHTYFLKVDKSKMTEVAEPPEQGTRRQRKVHNLLNAYYQMDQS